MITKIRYDVSCLKFVDGSTTVENKTVYINDENPNENISLNRKVKKILNWIKSNLNTLEKMGVDKINLELKYSMKTKITLEDKKFKQTEEKKLSIYDLSDNSFTVIDNFHYGDNLIELINRNKQKNQLKKNSSETVTEFYISKDMLSELIRQFIKSISFENLSGDRLKYNLNHINKKIFNKEITISVFPREKYDDQGFSSRPVCIINKGVFVHTLCLNENIPLNDSCIGGYTVIDEFRRASIEVGSISIKTKFVQHLVQDIKLKYNVFKVYLDKNNLVYLSLFDEKKVSYHIVETMENFFNNLIYVENQQIYSCFMK